jgi:phosphoribosyl 1,2-cyclic phosphodiesterase
VKLTVINSNSAGNAYILESSIGEALLIECGVRWDVIRKALNFNVRKVVGCLITHEHKDHCKSVKDVMNSGINVYSSFGSLNAMGVSIQHRAHAIVADSTFQIGDFHILPFKTEHDCADPFGYLIYHSECGTVLFLTDSYYSQHKFTGLNNIIIEANYCQKILDKRVLDGANPKFLRDRVITSHMSLDTCKLTLQANDLSEVNNIVLIHLSDGNSDSSRFQREVQEATGKTVHIASAGMVIENFNKKPF